MTNFKEQAKSLGICKSGLHRWDDNNLIGMYLDGINWCLQNKFPALEDMLPYDKDLIERGVYNNKPIDLKLTDAIYVLNNCAGACTITEWDVSRIYVSRDSVIDVHVKDNSILFIDTYDNAVIRLYVDKKAVCQVEQYGNSVIQIISGNAKIVKR